MARRPRWLVVAVFGLLFIACSGPSTERTPTQVAAFPSATLTATSSTPTAATATSDPTHEQTATSTSTTQPTATLTPTLAPAATATATVAPAVTPTPTIPPPKATATTAPMATATPDEGFIVFTRDDTTEKTVALTFDAGSDTGFAEDILDILEAEDVAATFGMTGTWAEDNPDLIQRMVDGGFPLMNHTMTHLSWTGASTGADPLSSAERRQELVETEDIVRSIAGVELAPYFRPPYGDYDDSVIADLEANGYSVMAMWTIDSLGWDGLSAEEINERVLGRMEPGAIVLLHVGAASQDAAALPAMIDELRAMGYRFVTVQEMVGR
jgi:peptidoglycan/xylan/chitin deacetylase (PgdA/CDA1 family)